MVHTSIRKIVVAIDFGDESAEILQVAAELGCGLGAEVHLVHVYDPKPLQVYDVGIYPVMMPGETVAEHEAVLKEEREQLRGQSTFLREAGVKTFAYMKPIDKSVSKSILHFASSYNGDLILLGTSRPNRIEEMLIGSVAKKVLRKSQIPVLLIPRIRSEPQT